MFLNQVRTTKSVDFPEAARKVRLDYFKDIEPYLLISEFRVRVEEVIKEIRFELVNRALSVGLNGKADDGLTPDLSYINAVIKHLDSGILLPPIKAGVDDPKDEDLTDHLSRLGLSGTEETPPQTQREADHPEDETDDSQDQDT